MLDLPDNLMRLNASDRLAVYGYAHEYAKMKLKEKTTDEYIDKVLKENKEHMDVLMKPYHLHPYYLDVNEFKQALKAIIKACK